MTDRPRFSAIRWILVLVSAGAGVVVGAYWHAPLLRLAGVAPGGSSEAAHGTAKDPGGSATTTQLWTCGMHPQVIQDHPGTCPICHMTLVPLTPSGSAAGGSTVQIDPAIVQNMGVRLAKVTSGPLQQTLRATANVVEPETARVDISLRVSGWIEVLHANTEGMEIKKGEPLFDLYSPEVTQAIEELIAARHAGSSSGAQDATASLVNAARNRLLLQGLTEQQVESLGSLEHAPRVVTFVSPADGTLVDKMGTNAGSAVAGGQLVLRLVDRSTMWIEGRVPEGMMDRVAIGRTARVRVAALPGAPLEGTVTFVHPRLDEGTRTGMVRVAVGNKDGVLRGGMYATMEIDTGDAGPTTQIPREAVIDTGESQIVLVSLGGGRFEPREVRLGRNGDRGMVEVLSGLSPTDEVVASGQFLIDSESRLREAIAKFLNHTKGAAGASGPGIPASADPNSPAPRTHAPTTWAPSALVDAVVKAYLPLAEALGAEHSKDTPLDCAAIVSALHALHAQVSAPEGVTMVVNAAKAAEAMKDKPLETQREGFKALSNAMIALVDAMPPSPDVADSLYVVHCPMAPGNWLQRTRDVANPYYATDMKACGTVVRPIGEAKGGN